jgi:hypothetical protein
MELNTVIITASLSLFILGFFVAPSASHVNQTNLSQSSTQGLTHAR